MRRLERPPTGWNATDDTTLRMHSVATGNLLHDGVVNPTVNAAVAPDYLARVWHQRRAEITGDDDQRRPTVFFLDSCTSRLSSACTATERGRPI